MPRRKPQSFQFFVPAIRDLADASRQRQAVTGVGLTPQQLGGAAEGAIRGAAGTAAAVNLQERQFAEERRSRRRGERLQEQELSARRRAATASGVTQLAQLGVNTALTKQYLAQQAGATVGAGATPAVTGAATPAATAGLTAATTGAGVGAGTVAGAGAGAGGAAATGVGAAGTAAAGGAALTFGAGAVGGVAGARFAESQGADESGQLFAAALAGGAAGAGTGAIGGPYGTAGGFAVGAVLGAAGYLASDSGGGTVLCTELHRQGLMCDTLYAVDSMYGVFHVEPDVMAGYQKWGIPLARAMSKSKRLTSVLKPFITAWAEEMASRINPHFKGNLAGKAMMKVGFPVCRWLGRKRLEVAYG